MPTNGHSEGEELAQTFSKMARILISQSSPQAVLDRIVQLALTTVEHCEAAGITRIVDRKVESPASSGPISLRLDQIQADTDEGPCLDALRHHEIFITGDLAAEQRWPKFAARAVEEMNVHSILSVRLYIEQNTLGSLNLYSTKRNAFSDSDIAVASVFATHAAVAMLNAARIEQLAERGDSRDLIGRAKGILMATHRVDDAQAFKMLVDASQQLNIKLAAVAEDVNYTGELRRSPPPDNG